jgi:hypothetical protein
MEGRGSAPKTKFLTAKEVFDFLKQLNVGRAPTSVMLVEGYANEVREIHVGHFIVSLTGDVPNKVLLHELLHTFVGPDEETTIQLEEELWPLLEAKLSPR